MLRSFRLLLLATLVALVLPITANAQDKACMDCHADTAESSTWRPVVRAERWAGSVHAEIACAECHGEPRSTFAHCPYEKPEAKPKACVACHEDQASIQAEFDASAHAGTTVDCSSCHDPHEFPKGLTSKPREERVVYANAKCQVCHNDTVYRVVGKATADLPSTAHDWLPFTDKHARIRCVVCHADTKDEHSHAILPKAQSTRDCAACHAEDAELIAKYVGEDDGSGSVTNPALAEEVVMPGAVRNRAVDRVLLWLAALAALGCALHGLLRILTAGRRAPPTGRVERVYLYSLRRAMITGWEPSPVHEDGAPQGDDRA